MRQYPTLPGFNAVAAGQTAVCDAPAIDTYAALKLVYGTSTAGGANQANMEAEITEVRLKLNGNIQRRFSAAELFVINATYGIPFAAGYLPIYFACPWQRSALGEDALAWGMADVQQFQIEVDIDAGAASPTLRGVAERIPVAQRTGQIVKWKKASIPVTATGEREISPNKGDAYYAVHASTANINSVRALLEGQEIINLTRGDITQILADQNLTQQAGYTSLIFDATRRVSDALPTRSDNGLVKDFRLIYDMSSATTFTAISETLGPRD